MKQMFVYILFNHSRTLYIGVTSDMVIRMDQHHRHVVPGFTAKYNITMLAYYEMIPDPMSAIRREKQLKGWNRAKKIALIESMNPHWDDLSVGLIERIEGPLSLTPSSKKGNFGNGSHILREYAQDGARAGSNAGALLGVHLP